MITLPNGIDIHPNYVIDDAGKKVSVILTVAEFNALMEAVLRKLKPAITPNDDFVPKRVALDIANGLKEIKKGNENFSDAYEFLEEMRAEYPSKKETV